MWTSRRRTDGGNGSTALLSIRVPWRKFFLALRDLNLRQTGVRKCLPLPLTEATPLLERVLHALIGFTRHQRNWSV